MASSKLKEIPLNKIVVGDRARKDLGDIEGLMEAIKEKGLIQPIAVKALSGGTFELLAGGRRYTACTRLEHTKIPAIVLEPDDDVDAMEIELFENVFRKDFSWDERVQLVKKIDDLHKSRNTDWSGRKTANLLGVSPAQTCRQLQLAAALELMPELKTECKDEASAFKALKKMEEQVATDILRERQEQRIVEKTRTSGEKHFLAQASKDYTITDIFDALPRIPAGSPIHFIECDPPYGIDLPTAKGSAAEYHEVKRDDYSEFLHFLADNLYRVAAHDSWMLFWFGITHFTLVKQCLEDAGWEVDDIPGIWTKSNGQNLHPELHLTNCYETFFVCRKGKPHLTKPGIRNVFSSYPMDQAVKYHPTERPVKLVAELLDIFTLPHHNVFVPFLGSGATLRACYLTGHHGFGYDKDDSYRDKFMLAVEEDMKKLNKGE